MDTKLVNYFKLRQFVYRQIEPSAREKAGLSITNKILVFAIILGTITAIISTEPSIPPLAKTAFNYFEIIFGLIFLVEYIARLWCAPETDKTKSATRNRLNFILSISGIIDLAVVVSSLIPIFASNIALLRIIRLIRILRLAKLGRLSLAMKRLGIAIHSRRYELTITLMFAIGLLLLGSSALYLIEGEIQPDKFGSIPRALWWSIVTLTTIGYGDVYPVTPLGKLVAAFVAVAGIGIVALPAGILAAAFSDAMQKLDKD